MRAGTALRFRAAGISMIDILLLDDDEDLLESVSDLLESLSACRVWKARSVDELGRIDGQALVSRVAILDINLGPGVPSGIDALRWLRERGFAGDAVFLTGHARGFPLVEEAHRMGVRVLSKPLAIDNLLSLVEGGPP
jgi:DNA-binding NtrC family response regulator